MEEAASNLTSVMGPEFPKPFRKDDIGISWAEQNAVDEAVARARGADSHRIHERGVGGGVGGGVGEPPAEGGFGGLGGIVRTEDLMALEAARRTRGGESPTADERLVSAETPLEVITAERDFWEECWDYREMLDAYAQQAYKRTISRMSSYDRQLKRSYSKEHAQKHGRRFIEGERARIEEMRDALKTAVADWGANERLMKQFDIKQSIAADQKTLLFSWFLASQRPEVYAFDYAALFRAGPTEEGATDQGTLLDRAIRARLAAYRGELRDTKRTGSPYQGIEENARIDNPIKDEAIYGSTKDRFESWVTTNLTEGFRLPVLQAEAIDLSWNWSDDYACHGGFLESRDVREILENTGLLPIEERNDAVPHAKYLSSKYVRLCESRGDGKEPLKLETGADIVDDAAKARWPMVRAFSEQLGFAEEVRLSPNAVAAEATLGCFPVLTTSLPEIMTVTEITYDADGKPTKHIRTIAEIFESGTPLGELPWDRLDKMHDTLTVAGLTEDETEKLFRTTLVGIPRRGEKGTYELQKFYAYQVWESQMVKNMAEMGKKIADADFLRDLNKAYNLAYGLLWNAMGIPRDLQKLLLNNVKANLLVGIACANTMRGGNKKGGETLEDLRSPMVPPDQMAIKAFGSDEDRYLDAIENATTYSKFLPDPEMFAFVRHAVKTRRLGGKPSLFSTDKDGKPLFKFTGDKGTNYGAQIKSRFQPKHIKLLNDKGVYGTFKA